MSTPKIKPDKQLVKFAKQLGIELKKETPRKKGETLLQWRQRCWAIPQLTSAPIDNQVIVWRLPPLQLSPGGLVIPETEQSPNVKGVIMAMGPRAMDTLRSNGIEEGHVITFARFAGWELHDNTPEHMRHNQILIIKDKDVLGSDDLKRLLDAGKLTYVQDTDGRYKLAKVNTPRALPGNNGRKQIEGKKRKLLALASGTTNPHEAETARKLAGSL